MERDPMLLLSAAMILGGCGLMLTIATLPDQRHPKLYAFIAGIKLGVAFMLIALYVMN